MPIDATQETSILSGRLISIIESHAEEHTRGAVEKLQCSPDTRSYHGLSRNKLHHWLFEVYHDLGAGS
jgi:hypothetical protein